MSESRTHHRIPELDGIRGIAILMVLVYHFGAPSCPWLPLRQFISFGWTGVEVFFTLSGFLITGILLESKGSNGFFENFYLRRAFRIFPVYYAFIVFVLHVGPLLAHFRLFSFLARGAGQEWWYWLYLSNWSPFDTRIRNLAHFWSLCVEEQFYLFWPLLVRYSSRQTLKWICLGIAFGSPLLRFAALRFGANPFHLYEETIYRLDGLALGSLLAIASRDGSLHRAIERTSKVFVAAAIAVFAIIVWRYGSSFYSPAMTVVGHLAVSLISAFFIFHARSFSGLLGSRWLRRAGKYSYAAYVWHYPAAERLRIYVLSLHGRYSTGSMWIVFIACVAGGVVLSYVLALISWRLIEQPAARLKERYTRSLTAAAAL